MQEEMTEAELAEWRAYELLEPFGMRAFEMMHAKHLMAVMRRKAELDDVYPLSADDKRDAQELRREMESELPPEENQEFMAFIAKARAEQAAEQAKKGT